VNAHTTALLLQVAAKGESSAGSVTVSPANGPQSGSVFFDNGATSGNLAIVGADPDSNGRLGLLVTNTSVGAARVDLNLLGFYDDGGLGPNLRFRALPQTRVVDTTAGLGGSTLQTGRRSTVTPATSVVGDSTFGLVGVLTGTASAATTLGLDDAEGASSRATILPLGTSATSQAVQAEVGAHGRIALTVPDGTPPVSVTMDVVGSFEAYPPVGNPAARGWVPPVSSWQISAQVSAQNSGQVTAVSR
jgi:hypothetical protein